MALKRISKRQAIDYIQEHSNYILEGTSITLGKELLVAQAQLEADQKEYDALTRVVGKELVQLKAELFNHNVVIRKKDIEIMRLKEEIQMHEKTLQQLWELGQTIRG